MVTQACLSISITSNYTEPACGAEPQRAGRFCHSFLPPSLIPPFLFFTSFKTTVTIFRLGLILFFHASSAFPACLSLPAFDAGHCLSVTCWYAVLSVHLSLLRSFILSSVPLPLHLLSSFFFSHILPLTSDQSVFSLPLYLFQSPITFLAFSLSFFAYFESTLHPALFLSSFYSYVPCFHSFIYLFFLPWWLLPSIFIEHCRVQNQQV